MLSFVKFTFTLHVMGLAVEYFLCNERVMCCDHVTSVAGKE
jgi:hypothetical protein